MLDLCNPDCEWSGGVTFNECLQSICAFDVIRDVYINHLRMNMRSLKWGFEGRNV